MNQHYVDFLIQFERRRNEIALAAQHRQLKAARQEGLVYRPLFDRRRLRLSAITGRLAHSLAWLGRQYSRSRFALLSRGASRS